MRDVHALLIAGVLVIAGALAVICIIEVAQRHGMNKRMEVLLYTPRPVFRHIPQCDKELWLRIKEGCDA